MSLTIQILTKNNDSTIQNTLQSLQSLNARIIIGDLGSTDKTCVVCSKFNTEIYHLHNYDRDKARNLLSDKTKDVQFYIEPWELMIKTGKFIPNSYVKILNNKLLTWEIRVWKNAQFNNPICEQLDIDANTSDIVLASNGGKKIEMDKIEKWKKTCPTSPKPYYYQAFGLLESGRLDDFLQVAEHYMFIDKTKNMASVMMRYYYALIQLIHKKNHKKSLQAINLCLGEKPLMAEFWCLTGDIHYHILRNFIYAKEFYENAIIMGAKRLSNDIYPMDITKYREYPSKMIASCETIIKSQSVYVGNVG